MIQSVYFLPHGMQIIQRPEVPEDPRSTTLHNAMEEIRIKLEIDDPEFVFLITPHGYNLQSHYSIYLHNEFMGNYYVINEGKSVVYGDEIETRSWKGDENTSKSLVKYLKKKNLDMQGLTLGFADYPMTLAWGETVPLFYLPENNKSKLIILGIPRNRHERIKDIQKDLFTLGQSLIEFCSKLDSKVSIIFSGDLSHTHIKTGPYGFHESSKEFDKLIQNWSIKPDRVTFDMILDLQKTALACGMAGISMLQGIHEKYGLINKFSLYDLPSYFGMIANQWKLKS